MEQTLSTVLRAATAAELVATASPHQKQASEKAMEYVVWLSVNPGSPHMSRHAIQTVECPVCCVPYPSEPIRNLLAEQLAQTLSLF